MASLCGSVDDQLRLAGLQLLSLDEYASTGGGGWGAARAACVIGVTRCLSGCDLAAKVQTGVDLGRVTVVIWRRTDNMTNMAERGRLMTIPTQPLCLNTFLVGPLRQDTMGPILKV